MALTNSDLQALRNYHRTPEGQVFVAMLKRKLSAVDEQLRVASGEDLYRKQGRAQELAELLGQITGADQALRRQEQPWPRMQPMALA